MDLPERVREEVWNAADYRGCCLVSTEDGICARGAGGAEIHHVQYRSAGGSDDPSNLLLVCGFHHRAIHAGTLKPSGTGKTLTFTEGEVVWEVWPNVKEKYEWEAEQRRFNFKEHIQAAGCELLRGCRELGYLVDRNLLWIHDCANLEEFAVMSGVARKTMWGWARIGAWLIDLNDNEFDVLVKLPYWRVRDSLPSLRRLGTSDRLRALQEIVRAGEEGQPGQDLERTIEELEESPTGEYLFDVAVKVDGTAHWRLRAADVKDAIDKAKTRTLGYKPFRPLLKGDPHSVDLGDVYAERVGVGMDEDEIGPSAASHDLGMASGDDEQGA